MCRLLSTVTIYHIIVHLLEIQIEKLNIDCFWLKGYSSNLLQEVQFAGHQLNYSACE